MESDAWRIKKRIRFKMTETKEGILRRYLCEQEEERNKEDE